MSMRASMLICTYLTDQEIRCRVLRFLSGFLRGCAAYTTFTVSAVLKINRVKIVRARGSREHLSYTELTSANTCKLLYDSINIQCNSSYTRVCKTQSSKITNKSIFRTELSNLPSLTAQHCQLHILLSTSIILSEAH